MKIGIGHISAAPTGNGAIVATAAGYRFDASVSLLDWVTVAPLALDASPGNKRRH